MLYSIFIFLCGWLMFAIILGLALGPMMADRTTVRRSSRSRRGDVVLAMPRISPSPHSLSSMQAGDTFEGTGELLAADALQAAFHQQLSRLKRFAYMMGRTD